MGENYAFSPNDEQRDVIKFGKGNLLVEAGPGSGKTTVIVERIKRLIKKELLLGRDPGSGPGGL